jgi:ABC-type nitrate/sulfonate/bicarbonate transport system permease component
MSNAVNQAANVLYSLSDVYGDFAMTGVIVFMTIWKVCAVNSQRNTFLFSRLSKILNTLVDKSSSGELIRLFFAFEMFAGLLVGVLTGNVIDFLLRYFPKASKFQSIMQRRQVRFQFLRRRQ